MRGTIIGLVALVVVLSTSIVLYFETQRTKSDLNKKIHTVVNQINDSQLYGFNFDKQQEENIQNVDRNITSLYDAIIEAQKNIKFMQANIINKDDIGKKINTTELKTGLLKLGEKYSLSGVGDNTEWLKLFDKDGGDYYGGMAMKNLWTRDNAFLNGTTTISGSLNAQGNSAFKGGKSEMNPDKLGSYFPYLDGFNYIRGDTEIKGHVNNLGSMKTDRLKVNHGMGGWTDNSVLTTYAPGGKIGASFMGDKYASHFPYDGSVYIRPGNDGKGIMIGDMGAPYIQLRDSWFPNKVGDVIINPSTGGKVVIGQGTTAVNVEGTLGVANKLCLGDVCIDKNDLAKLKK
jgi:hypothetical protein